MQHKLCAHCGGEFLYHQNVCHADYFLSKGVALGDTQRGNQNKGDASLAEALVVELKVEVGLVKLKKVMQELIDDKGRLSYLVYSYITILSSTGITFTVRCEHHRVDWAKVSLHLVEGILINVSRKMPMCLLGL